ncbi:hypothetical protein GGR58DRAFT_316662 [Xylaria digitata]|nr:hypothetical protein GGR58DRAFT_316662 [Xylaria digitata]
MAEPPFKPYWRPMGRPAGPNSWVFFVVARIAGCHRPVAIVSSVGDNDASDSLQGFPLISCCRRIVTIFADSTNHVAIRAELALATSYYTTRSGDGGYGEHHSKPAELPEFHRRRDLMSVRERPWDCMRLPEFPFIATCLLQGVGFDPHTRRTAPIFLEPLATVYRDTSVEWGMVIADITDLETVRYGVVGFTVDMAKFIPSLEAEKKSALLPMGAMGPGAFEEGDDLRVIEDPRPRRAISAAEYMNKFAYKVPTYEGNAYTSELLAQIPLIGPTAMSLVWPLLSSNDNNVQPLPAPLSLPLSVERTQQDQAITKLIQTAIDLDHLDESVLAEVRSIPNFRAPLCHGLIQQYSDQLHSSTSNQSVGRLVRLAFAHHNHLGLEQLKHLSAGLISAAWYGSGDIDKNDVNDNLTSISLCIDSVWSTPAQLADILSQFDTLSDLYVLQSPTQECDTLGLRLLEELAARPPVLSRTKLMLASAYSSALRKKLWLPTPTISHYGDAFQATILDLFPVQQILVRHGLDFRGQADSYIYHCVSLHDGLLKPERFAAGFLLYLATLLPADMFNPKAQVFSFSSSPASLAADPSSAAQVSPILAENFALPESFPDDSACSPLVQDLVPRGWTVIVSQEIYPLPRGILPQQEPYYIHYAFVRPRRKPITVDHPPLLERLGPEELQVVGLKEFLAITSPEVDTALIDRRIGELQKQLAVWWGGLPSDMEHLSVLTQAEAAQALLHSLVEARRRKQRLCELARENNKEWNWYPEIQTGRSN